MDSGICCVAITDGASAIWLLLILMPPEAGSQAPFYLECISILDLGTTVRSNAFCLETGLGY